MEEFPSSQVASSSSIKKSSRNQKPKPSKTIPFYKMKKNPFLVEDTLSAAEGQGGLEEETSEQKVEMDPIVRMPKIRMKDSNTARFVTPLKRKCGISECMQCKKDRCNDCITCNNPQWKKGCKNKEPCPNLQCSSSRHEVSSTGMDEVPMNYGDVDVTHEIQVESSTYTHALSDSLKGSVQQVSELNLEVESRQTLDEDEKLVPENGPGMAITESSDDLETQCASETEQKSVGVKWQCNNCNKLFTQLKSFNKHKCDDSKTKIPCPSCNKLISKKFMPIHIKMHSKTKYQCQKCKRKFLTEGTLVQHMVIHELKVFKCNICGEDFNSNSILIKHIDSTHEEMRTVELKTENKCKHCDAVFHNLAILKKHLKKNHGEMATFKCDICPKMYFSARGLRSHQEIHKEVQTNETGEKDQREDDNNQCHDNEENYIIEVAENINLNDLENSDITFS